MEDVGMSIRHLVQYTGEGSVEWKEPCRCFGFRISLLGYQLFLRCNSQKNISKTRAQRHFSFYGSCSRVFCRMTDNIGQSPR